MKFRNYLQAIDGVAIYPLIGLLIFTGLFVGLVWYLVRMDKQTVQKMSRLPLEDGTVRNILSTILLLFVTSGAFAQAEVEKAGNKELVTYLILMVLLLVIVALSKYTLTEALRCHGAEVGDFALQVVAVPVAAIVFSLDFA